MENANKVFSHKFSFLKVNSRFSEKKGFKIQKTFREWKNMKFLHFRPQCSQTCFFYRKSPSKIMVSFFGGWKIVLSEF